MVASVGFGENIRLPNPFETVYEAVIGRAFDKTSRPAPGIAFPILLAVQQPRIHVRVEPKRWTVRTDQEASASDQLELLVDQYQRMHPYVEGLAVAHASLETQWIEPFEGPWADLAGQYRRAFYCSGALPEDATDYSVMFDVANQEFRAQLQSGPMERGQLNLYSAIYPEPPNIPDRFLYVRYDHSSLNPPEDVPRFLADTLSKAQRAADFHNERFQGVHDDHQLT